MLILYFILALFIQEEDSWYQNLIFKATGKVTIDPLIADQSAKLSNDM
jgi:hypothetical protein